MVQDIHEDSMTNVSSAVGRTYKSTKHQVALVGNTHQEEEYRGNRSGTEEVARGRIPSNHTSCKSLDLRNKVKV